MLLVRDGSDGVEVFMLERHLRSDFAGGALVFPGGKVDPADRSLPAPQWAGIDPVAVAERMQTDPGRALALHVAAVRETFEEAGFLFARRGGDAVTARDLEVVAADRARQAAGRADAAWAQFLAEHGLVLDLGALAWWSWWVTPVGLHRRYDTRFFVAAVPATQEGAHDDVETTSSRWTTPAAALEDAREGRAMVIYPTRKNLEALAAFASADEAVAAARAGEVDVRRVEPEAVTLADGSIGVRHPYLGEIADI